MKFLRPRLGVALTAALLLLAVWTWSAPGTAFGSAFQATSQPTPPAGADGRILYPVQADDTPWGIAAQFGMELTTLQNLNGWGSDTVVVPGQVVLLGTASQQEPTATAGPTTEVVATLPPEPPGPGSICVLLFDDVNGDATRQETEFGIAGGQASVNERTGLASRTAATESALDVEGHPIRTGFEDRPGGEYTISVAIPDGY